jgi:hypothetical protein
MGLASHQTNLFMNHLLEKDRSYQSEANRDLCQTSKVIFLLFIKCLVAVQAYQVLAGFSNTQEDYFVPWALFQLPHPIGWYEERLLPALAAWRQKAAHRVNQPVPTSFYIT